MIVVRGQGGMQCIEMLIIIIITTIIIILFNLISYSCSGRIIELPICYF